MELPSSIADGHGGPHGARGDDPASLWRMAWLATAPGTLADRSRSMIVELTPRVVARNAGWGNQTAILSLRGRHVRISGWLLLDQEHPEQLQKTRGTLWEIHPVMKIAVEQGGKWTDLATGKPDVAPAPGAASTPTASKTTPTPSKAGLQVRVTVQPNPTSDGTPTTVQATTSPGALCTVRVIYASGSASGSSALKTAQTAGSDGSVSWTWKPQTRRPGPATATVHCTLGSQSADGTAQFTVQG